MLDHPSPEVDNGDHEPHLGGRLIRPYSVTKGRTRPCFDIPIETLVRSTGRAAAPTLGAEERSILALLGGPISLAQIAARRGLGLVWCGGWWPTWLFRAWSRPLRAERRGLVDRLKRPPDR